jgi:hypothetical protein
MCLAPIGSLKAPGSASEVDVSQGDLLECPGFPMRRLAGLLRQHDYEERYDCYVPRPNSVCLARRRRFRGTPGACRQAQPVGISKTIRRMGPLHHLPALRNGEYAIAALGYS